MIMMNARKESGEITSDRKKNSKNMHSFLLYNQTVPTMESTMILYPGTGEIPEFTEEVERAIKRMKDTKSMEQMELQVI